MVYEKEWKLFILQKARRMICMFDCTKVEPAEKPESSINDNIKIKTNYFFRNYIFELTNKRVAIEKSELSWEVLCLESRKLFVTKTMLCYAECEKDLYDVHKIINKELFLTTRISSAIAISFHFTAAFVRFYSNIVSFTAIF